MEEGLFSTGDDTPSPDTLPELPGFKKRDTDKLKQLSPVKQP